MERERALRELPIAHSVALRLRAAGQTESLIADALGITVDALPSLLAIAEAKLSRLLAEPSAHPRTKQGADQ
jgi:hypothetical protein